MGKRPAPTPTGQAWRVRPGPAALAAPPQPPPQAAPAHAAAPPPAPKADNKTFTVNSPFVGTFYRSASPENPPFAEVGSAVKQGQVLCIVEAMKLMNEIEAELPSRVAEVLV